MAVQPTALIPGLTGTAAIIVAEQHTARQLGSGRMPVLATPALAALMEAAAQQAIDAHLPPEQQTIGTRIDLRHHGATPVGMHVRTTAELTAIDGRNLTFHIIAHDADEQIGEAQHVRVVTGTLAFERLLRRKTAAMANAADSGRANSGTNE
ncbi:MAG: thioesterase [Burkholderiaceae bacterium]|nr:thioesterase [Burkholderiaceae bacterium]